MSFWIRCLLNPVLGRKEARVHIPFPKPNTWSNNSSASEQGFQSLSHTFNFPPHPPSLKEQKTAWRIVAPRIQLYGSQFIKWATYFNCYKKMKTNMLLFYFNKSKVLILYAHLIYKDSIFGAWLRAKLVSCLVSHLTKQVWSWLCISLLEGSIIWEWKHDPYTYIDTHILCQALLQRVCIVSFNPHNNALR